MGPFKLTIARFPGNNAEHPDSSQYIMELMMRIKSTPYLCKAALWRASDTPITMTRNQCVLDALNRGHDYLLMIDSDMAPDCEPGSPKFFDVAWKFMMDRRLEEQELRESLNGMPHTHDELLGLKRQADRRFPPATIAAPYCGPPPIENVYVFRWAGQTTGDADQPWKLAMYDRDHAAEKTGIEEVAALPTGLILYDLRVFKKLPPPWFCYEWGDVHHTVKASTEDVFQTRNASIIGLPQFCAWDCWAGHHKGKMVVKPQPLTVRSVASQYMKAVIEKAVCDGAIVTMPEQPKIYRDLSTVRLPETEEIVVARAEVERLEELSEVLAEECAADDASSWSLDQSYDVAADLEEAESELARLSKKADEVLEADDAIRVVHKIAITDEELKIKRYQKCYGTFGDSVIYL